MANQFTVAVPNVLEAFAAGEAGYDKVRGIAKDRDQSVARQEAAAALQSGDPNARMSALARLMGSGLTADAQVLSGLGKADTTDDIKEFNLARQQGFQGTFVDYLRGNKAAGANKSNVVVNNGEKAYDSELGKDNAKLFLGYQTKGRDAAGALGTLGVLDKLTTDPRFYSGTGGEMVTGAKRAAASLGVASPDAAGPNELFGAMSNKLVLDAAGGSLGAQISNGDRDFIQRTAPSLGATPEGNRALIGIQKKIYTRNQEVAQLARDYVRKNNGRMDSGFEQVVADHAERNPLFKDFAVPVAAPSADWKEVAPNVRIRERK